MEPNEYIKHFEDSVSELPYEYEEDVVRHHLCFLEWALWENIKNCLFYFSSTLATIPFLLAWALNGFGFYSLWVSVALVLLFFGLALSVYGLLRFVFWYNFLRHFKDRKFGELP